MTPTRLIPIPHDGAPAAVDPSLDVEADGTRTWARTGPLYQAIPSDVREALREASR